MVSATRPARARGPYAKSARTQDAILDAALLVFAEGGFRAGSIQSVADAVGISEAALRHHFPRKTELLAAVLDRRDQKTAEMFRVDDKDGRDLLRSFVDLAEYNASTPGVVQLYCTLSAEATSPDHPAHEYFGERYVVSIALVRRALDTLRAEGSLAPEVDVAGAAVATVALMDGLQLQWLISNKSVDMAKELRTYLSSLLVDEL